MANFLTNLIDSVGRNAKGIATIRNSFDPPSNASRQQRIAPEELKGAEDSGGVSPLLVVGLGAAALIGAVFILKK